MERMHIAAVMEDHLVQSVGRLLHSRGWHNRTIPYIGYGNPETVRILGRVVLTRGKTGSEHSPGDDIAPVGARHRGWSMFVTVTAGDVPVVLRIAGKQVDCRTDRGGYIDVDIADHGLPPGWHQITIIAEDAAPIEARVRIIGPETTSGLVSDVDDTIMVTALPRPLIAAWNTFLRHESSRRPVPGMAAMYGEFLDRNPDAVVVYVSTGAWNTVPTLLRFLKRHDYPVGPMMMTDWGPTNTGWFRSGQEHKHSSLRALTGAFPQISWLLVGDDGQHDPQIYGEFADHHPDRVAAIAIRELTPGQQVLSHGSPLPADELARRQPHLARVPEYRAPDGDRLGRLLAAGSV